MSKEKQDVASKHFGNEKSAIYDDLIRWSIPGYDAMHDMARLILKQHATGESHVLVVGAGTGMETVALSDSSPEWSIVAVDPSEAMLATASEKINEKGLAERISLKTGYVSDLDSDPIFDAATSILVMHFIPDNGAKEDYLKEIGKRIKKGGKMVLVDVGKDIESGYSDSVVETWKNYQKEKRIDPENVDKDFEHITSDVYPVTEERTMELLAKTGFGKVERFYQALVFKGYVATKK